MIIVTGTRRSGTSMWMHVLVEAGLPYIGERFPSGWGELLCEANPDGFFESELMNGINYRTNPHPLTGAYLSPKATQGHAVKVFAPGLVRSDVAFIDRCIATVRPWRDYVISMRRVGIDQRDMPPALDWWTTNFALIRDLAIRGYPAHVLSYESFLRDPERVATEVFGWIGRGDPAAATRVVRAPPSSRATPPADHELADGLDTQHLAVFDELYAHIDEGHPLAGTFIEQLNATDRALRPLVLEYRAGAEARVIADVFGRE